MSPPSRSKIDQQAAAWLARVHSGEVSPEDQLRLEAWLAEDRRHQGAYMRAEAAFAVLDRAQGLSEPGFTRISASNVPHRRQILMGGMAAACAGLLGLGYWVQQSQTLMTETGELRKVPLKDRSVVSLNTQTEIGVNMTPKSRDIALIKGEAWFEVAKNPEAPFVVEAGDVRVRAVGTAFSVRKREGGADVLVTEGVVEAWSQRDDQKKVRLLAGDMAFVPEMPEAVTVHNEPVAIERRLAWRDRQIILDDITLSEAAAEFNRYNAQQITILDPVLGQARLVGGFEVNHPESFSEAVKTAFNTQVVVENNRILIGQSPKAMGSAS